MEDSNKEYGNILGGSFKIAVCIVIGLWVISWLCSGCEFLRKFEGKKNTQKDTSQVDTGSVKKNTVETKKDNQYEKTTYIYPPKDTNVFNIQLPEYRQPQVVIHEKGNASEQTKQTGVDSNWFNAKLEQLKQNEEKKTKTESSLLSPMFLLALGFFVLMLLLMGVFILYVAKKLNAVSLIQSQINKVL